MTGRKLLLSSALLLIGGGPSAGRAQDGRSKVLDAAVKPRGFDVASIKQNEGENESFRIDVGHDRISAQNSTLNMLLVFAYHTKPELIFGLSGAVDAAHFDLEAKVLPDDSGKPAELSDKELEAMLQPLLAERFKLMAHVETKTLPVYEMVVAKGGAKMALAAADVKHGNYRETWSKTRDLTATGISMTDLAGFLSDKTHRTVIDKTGLAARYDFNLKWSPEDALAEESVGSSIFTAVQEQLGLKLQPAKGPVKTLVVDHVEMPSKN